MKPKNFPVRKNERRRKADPTNSKIMPDAQARNVRTKKVEAEGWSDARRLRRRGKIAR